MLICKFTKRNNFFYKRNQLIKYTTYILVEVFNSVLCELIEIPYECNVFSLSKIQYQMLYLVYIGSLLEQITKHLKFSAAHASKCYIVCATTKTTNNTTTTTFQSRPIDLKSYRIQCKLSFVERDDRTATPKSLLFSQ